MDIATTFFYYSKKYFIKKCTTQIELKNSTRVVHLERHDFIMDHTGLEPVTERL